MHCISETNIQKTVMQWVKLHPLLCKSVIHIPNEGKRSLQYGKLLKDMGMRAGVSDLFITLARHDFIGAWIELKSKKGRLTPEQSAFMDDMEQHGYITVVCRSIESTIDFIKWYCFAS